MTSRGLTWGTGIGIALGVAYAASPLTVWFVIAMTGLFVWAGRGLTGGERRAVWAVLAVAVGIRVVALALLFLASDPSQLVSFFWDGDGVYLKYRAMVIRDIWADVPVTPSHRFHALDAGYGWSNYLYVLAFLQYLTGPAPYGVHLFNVAAYMTGSVVMHRVVRRAYGRAPALIGLALMLLMPTLISWSVSALKEALYVCLCAVGVMGVVTAIRGPRPYLRIAGIALLAGAIAATGSVRTGGAWIMVAGLGAGLAGSLIARRVTLVLLLLVVVPLAAWRLWEIPRTQAVVMERLKNAAVRHVGNVMTDGNAYRLLDRRLYSPGAINSMRPDEGLRFAVRALVSFVAVPLPWQVVSRAELVFLGQQVVWYMVVALGCVGFIAGLRRDALVTCLLTGLSAAGALTVALSGGNVGTLVRFRDTIVPFVVWLGALGATSMVARALPPDVMMRKAPCP